VALLPASLAACAAPLLPAGVLREAILRIAELVAGLTVRAVEEVAAYAPQAERAGASGLAWLLAAGLLLALGLRARSLVARTLLLCAELAVLGLAPPASFAPLPPRLVAIDVGQGDAILLQGRRAALLVDAGTALEGGLDLGERAVVPTLRALGVSRLDLAVVTHADLDHRGGMPALLERIPVAEVWLPFGASREPAYDTLRASARRRGVPVRERGAGSPPLAVGDLRATPLWPPPVGEPASRNDRSLVLRVEVAGRRVLLTGDLEAAGERALLASGLDLRADVLKLGHHGSRTSSSAALLAAVDPKLAVASAACAGRFGMPHPEALARARAAGLPVWWTGRHGAVLVGLGAPLWVHGFGEDRPHCAAPAREAARGLRAKE
jgi:competence protein ComEC